MESPKKSRCRGCKAEIPFYEPETVWDARYGMGPTIYRECESCAVRFLANLKDRELKDVPRRMELSGVPKKFSFDRVPALAESLLPFIPKGAEGRGLCLTGKVGVGKTTQLVALIKAHLLSRCEFSTPTDTPAGWKFVSFPAFIMRVQDSYRHDKGEKTALELLDGLAEVPFLAIDDMGVEKPTDFVRQATYYVIDEREKNLRPTFITTNFPLDQLSVQIDGRIASRIAGMCDVREIKGNDRRVR
jgi:DNA replication protein DnaC